MTPAPPRRRARRQYQKHGLVRLKAAVRGLGARVIDRRTSIGKALDSWRVDLLADLGGAPAVSTQQAALVDLAVRTKLMLDSIDAWILTQPSLVNARKRALLPVVRERASLASQFQAVLRDLGLERRARPAPSLSEILARKADDLHRDLHRDGQPQADVSESSEAAS